MNRVIRNKILVNYLIENGVAKNQRDLGAKMGYTNESAFSQVINEKVPTPKDFIAKLKTLLPTLNDDWLLYGEGTMLKTEATMTPYPIEGATPQGGRYIVRNHKKATPAHIGNIANSLRAQGAIELQGVATVGTAAPIAIIGDSGALLDPTAPSKASGTLPKAQQSATPTEAMTDGVNVVTDASALDLSVIPAEVVEEIKAEIKSEEAVPIIPAEIANRTETDIKEYIEDNAAELEHFRPGDMTANADGAEKVQKTSMLPTFVPNDIIFIKFLRDKTKIIDGLTYYFDLRSRPTMIRKVKIEGDKLRLIAQNPDYGDIITTFDDVLNVANIVGLFRKTFGDQYSELESVRRQKDTLIQEQIKQNGEALKTIDRLVTVIEKKL